MSDIKCSVTVSSMDDSEGYKLQSVEITDLNHLYTFLSENELRAKIQKINLINTKNPEYSIAVVVESLVKK